MTRDDYLGMWREFIPQISLPFPNRFTFSLYEDTHFVEVRAQMTSAERDSARDTMTLTNSKEIRPIHDWGNRFQIVLDLVLGMYDHEIREQLLFDGNRVFDPHLE